MADGVSSSPIKAPNAEAGVADASKNPMAMDR